MPAEPLVDNGDSVSEDNEDNTEDFQSIDGSDSDSIDDYYDDAGSLDTDAYQNLSYDDLWDTIRKEGNPFFPGGEWLRVIKLPKYDGAARKLLKVVEEILRVNEGSFTRILDMPPKQGRRFCTVRQICGAFRPDGTPTEASVLFVSFPALSLGPEQESVTLSRFLGLNGSPELEEPQVRVHGSWFLAVGDGLVALQPGGTVDRSAVLLKQTREGAAHFLARAMTNALHSSDDGIVEGFGRQFLQHQISLEQHKLGIARAGVTRGNTYNSASTLLTLELAHQDLISMAMISSVVQEQIKVLAKLRRVLERRIATFQWDNHTDGSINESCTSDMKEQLGCVLPVLEKEMEYRQRLMGGLEDRGSKAQLSYDQLVKLITATNFERQSKREMKLSRSALDELLNATLKTADMLAAQGALFSIAAIITSIFAPLAFLAQYFALPFIGGELLSSQSFWGVTGPFTGGFFILILIIICFSKYPISELRLFFVTIPNLFRLRALHRPKNRAKLEWENREHESALSYSSPLATLLGTATTTATATATGTAFGATEGVGAAVHRAQSQRVSFTSALSTNDSTQGASSSTLQQSLGTNRVKSWLGEQPSQQESVAGPSRPGFGGVSRSRWFRGLFGLPEGQLSDAESGELPASGGS